MLVDEAAATEMYALALRGALPIEQARRLPVQELGVVSGAGREA